MDNLRLTDYLAEYDAAESRKGFSLAWIRILIKELRKGKISRPDIVLEWGPKLLPGESYIEVWNLHEQICVAALDEGDLALAGEKVELLRKQFKESNRVSRLEGMLLEAAGRYDEAIVIYDAILQNDLANIAAFKRKACIYKAQGDVQGHVGVINAILKFFPADAGSWLELGELYMSLCDYQAAVHCFEELILLDSRNAQYHCRLAEAFYSQGGVENIQNARKYFTLSLNFQAPKLNLRSLYGLLFCCKALQVSAPSEKFTGSKKPAEVSQDTKVNEELLKYAKGHLDGLANGNESITFVQTSVL